MADEVKTALSTQQPAAAAVPRESGTPLPSSNDSVHHPLYSGRRHRMPPGSAALTRRALAMGLVLVAYQSPAFTPYNDYILHNSPFIGNHFPISVVSIMILLIAVWNPALRAGAKYPTLPGAIVGAGLTAVTVFILHTSEFVHLARNGRQLLGLPAEARQTADHLSQKQRHAAAHQSGPDSGNRAPRSSGEAPAPLAAAPADALRSRRARRHDDADAHRRRGTLQRTYALP